MSVSTGQTDQGDDPRVIVPPMDDGEHWGTPRTGASHDDAYAAAELERRQRRTESMIRRAKEQLL